MTLAEEWAARHSRHWPQLQTAREAIASRNCWETRQALSQAHERVAADILCGYARVPSWPIGQAFVPEGARRLLRRTTLKLRYWPDILAIQLPHAWLIDAKAEAYRDSVNYAVEKDAHTAHRMWAVLSGGQTLYLWDDFNVSRVSELQLTRSGPFRGRGSGTEFWLIDKLGADGRVYELREFFNTKPRNEAA